VNRNQIPKFDEDDENDGKEKDLNAKFLSSDLHEKITKIDVVMKHTVKDVCLRKKLELMR
jgi:hypothetical protein